MWIGLHFTGNAGDAAVYFGKFEASEEAIPEGKNGSKILARYLIGVVMHSVNARGNENGLKEPKVYFCIRMDWEQTRYPPTTTRARRDPGSAGRDRPIKIAESDRPNTRSKFTRPGTLLKKSPSSRLSIMLA